jgi:hypothetical protein
MSCFLLLDWHVCTAGLVAGLCAFMRVSRESSYVHKCIETHILNPACACMCLLNSLLSFFVYVVEHQIRSRVATWHKLARRLASVPPWSASHHLRSIIAHKKNARGSLH